METGPGGYNAVEVRVGDVGFISFAEAISSACSMFYSLKIILPTEIPLLSR
jgi:hypothetical protein